MPLVHIDLLRGRAEDELNAITTCVHEALAAELGVPERDDFQVLTEHDRLTDRIGLRSEDLTVVLSENGREVWSFGNCEANYLVLPPESWK